jgi:ParB-like chromosome segregation protein Spo0J
MRAKTITPGHARIEEIAKAEAQAQVSMVPFEVSDKALKLSLKLTKLEDEIELTKEEIRELLLDNNLKSLPTPAGTAWVKTGSKDFINTKALREAGVSNEVLGRAAWGVNKAQLVEAGVDDAVIESATSSTPWVSSGVTRPKDKTPSGGES